jgi:hypothetical protein
MVRVVVVVVYGRGDGSCRRYALLVMTECRSTGTCSRTLHEKLPPPPPYTFHIPALTHTFHRLFSIICTEPHPTILGRAHEPDSPSSKWLDQAWSADHAYEWATDGTRHGETGDEAVATQQGTHVYGDTHTWPHTRELLLLVWRGGLTVLRSYADERGHWPPVLRK